MFLLFSSHIFSRICRYCLSMNEVSLNNSVHVLSGLTRFYVNFGLHHRVTFSLAAPTLATSSPCTPCQWLRLKVNHQVNQFWCVARFGDYSQREEESINDFVEKRKHHSIRTMAFHIDDAYTLELPKKLRPQSDFLERAPQAISFCW
ncbi:hypothetical protein PsorP6_000736 [Peronosclerospora sorghi]|uniref:Uncharacterized protein n=1 Tax=Peronosclerospora sorghi TaxID=230839 RepID=A0ACC0WSW6_9STRA|nr:hypothetical protein PsorP6_000736 [Peronosclerospora sorghi]